MRRLALAALFMTTSALACPNLSGTYLSCVTEGEETSTTQMVVSQKLQNRVTTYNIDSKSIDDSGNEMTVSETYRADGKTVVTRETDPDTGMTADFSTTVNCNGTKSLEIKMKLSLDGEEMVMVTSSVSKVGTALKTVSRSVSMGEETTQTTICE